MSDATDVGLQLTFEEAMAATEAVNVLTEGLTRSTMADHLEESLKGMKPTSATAGAGDGDMADEEDDEFDDDGEDDGSDVMKGKSSDMSGPVGMCKGCQGKFKAWQDNQSPVNKGMAVETPPEITVNLDSDAFKEMVRESVQDALTDMRLDMIGEQCATAKGIAVEFAGAVDSAFSPRLDAIVKEVAGQLDARLSRLEATMAQERLDFAETVKGFRTTDHASQAPATGAPNPLAAAARMGMAETNKGIAATGAILRFTDSEVMRARQMGLIGPDEIMRVTRGVITPERAMQIRNGLDAKS